MKSKYNLPYYSIDIRESEKPSITIRHDDPKIVLDIEVLSIELNPQYDIVIEFENSQTFYRHLHILKEAKTSLSFDTNEVGSKLEYSINIVANKDGDIVFNESTTEFYEKGDYIGLVEKNIIHFEEVDGISGLIKIARSNTNNISYDLTSDWITVSLPENTYDKFLRWQSDDGNTPVALACIGLSCIQFAIFKALKQPDEFREKKWWETITKLLEESGYTANLDDEEIPEATNRILGDAIQGMINTVVKEIEQDDISNFT